MIGQRLGRGNRDRAVAAADDRHQPGRQTFANRLVDAVTRHSGLTFGIETSPQSTDVPSGRRHTRTSRESIPGSPAGTRAGRLPTRACRHCPHRRARRERRIWRRSPSGPRIERHMRRAQEREHAGGAVIVRRHRRRAARTDGHRPLAGFMVFLLHRVLDYGSIPWSRRVFARLPR